MQGLKELEVGSLRSEPVTVDATFPVSKLIGAIKEHGVYEVFVVEKSKIGMITVRDLLRAKNVSTSGVSALLAHVPKLQPTQKVSEAARIMCEYRIRALPIVEGNSLVGAIQARSILSVMKGSEVGRLAAERVMTAHPVTLDQSASVMKARNLMIRRDIDHLPILGSGELQGMLSSSHVLYNMIPPESPRIGGWTPEDQRRLDMPVKALMDSNPICCDTNEKVDKILGDMAERNADYCIVKLWEELQGILTYRDLMKLLVEKPETGVPVYMVGLPEDPFEAEAAKTKFTRIVNMLNKSFPRIEEARSKIKSEERQGKERRRYEVSVTIKTTKKVYSYSEVGWDLAAVFDIISSRLKRLLTEKPVRRRRDVRGSRPVQE